MRRIREAALALSLGVALATHAEARDYTIIGTGLRSCGAWTTERKDFHSSVHLLFEQWVLGFIAGEAYQGATDPLDDTDADGVWAWIDNYCAIHPLDKQVQAAKAFYEARVGPD